MACGSNYVVASGKFEDGKEYFKKVDDASYEAAGEPGDKYEVGDAIPPNKFYCKNEKKKCKGGGPCPEKKKKVPNSESKINSLRAQLKSACGACKGLAGVPDEGHIPDVVAALKQLAGAIEGVMS